MPASERDREGMLLFQALTVPAPGFPKEKPQSYIPVSVLVSIGSFALSL